MADLPARIDRAALERIIQRAAELQTGERELGDDLTEDQVLKLGGDVGIPGRYLRQALLEERVRAEPAESRLARPDDRRRHRHRGPGGHGVGRRCRSTCCSSGWSGPST